MLVHRVHLRDPRSAPLSPAPPPRRNLVVVQRLHRRPRQRSGVKRKGSWRCGLWVAEWEGGSLQVRWCGTWEHGAWGMGHGGCSGSPCRYLLDIHAKHSDIWGLQGGLWVGSDGRDPPTRQELSHATEGRANTGAAHDDVLGLLQTHRGQQKSGEGRRVVRFNLAFVAVKEGRNSSERWVAQGRNPGAADHFAALSPTTMLAARAMQIAAALPCTITATPALHAGL